MSWHQWTDQGYGFPLWNTDNTQNIKDFIIKHDDAMDDETKAEFKCLTDPYDIEEFIGEPVSYLIARIINKLEHVSFFVGYDACGDTDQDEMIGIAPAYPWEFSHAECAITCSMAHSMLKKYGKELGVTEGPDFFEAEYCG